MQTDHAENTGAFDEDEALARVDGDREFLLELAGLFQSECPHWMDEIAQGLSKQAGPAVSGAAHSLKGAAANFAAETTVAAAQQLETSAKCGDFSTANAAYQILVREVGGLLRRLEKLTGSLAAQTLAG